MAKFKKTYVSKNYGEALERARTSHSEMNEKKVKAHFMNKLGIEVNPREDCLTYKAWLALGKQVRKGEHGCSVMVFNKDATTGKTRVYHATVFHVSQTDKAGTMPKQEKKVEKTAPVVVAPAEQTTHNYNFSRLFAVK